MKNEHRSQADVAERITNAFLRLMFIYTSIYTMLITFDSRWITNSNVKKKQDITLQKKTPQTSFKALREV